MIVNCILYGSNNEYRITKVFWVKEETEDKKYLSIDDFKNELLNRKVILLREAK